MAISSKILVISNQYSVFLNYIDHWLLCQNSKFFKNTFVGEFFQNMIWPKLTISKNNPLNDFINNLLSYWTPHNHVLDHKIWIHAEEIEQEKGQCNQETKDPCEYHPTTSVYLEITATTSRSCKSKDGK